MHVMHVYMFSLINFRCIEIILKKHASQREARDKRYKGTPLHWAQTREVSVFYSFCKLSVPKAFGYRQGETQIRPSSVKKRWLKA